ncbi:MAG: hypothetical protein JNN33_04155, partial [Rhodospirillaceae bacterium]|nr:hypothetical protein [Rhodospirillaceae bacterium]
MTAATQVETSPAAGASGLGRAIAGLLREIVTVVEAANDGQLIEFD